jgi:multidrug efflux system outer membrane protein
MEVIMKRYAVLFLILLAACSLAPKLEQPAVDTPAQWKELSESERGVWKTAQPADAESRGEWWKVFGDPLLDQFEAEAVTANQNLKAAAARVAQVRALVGVANAERYPTVGYGFGPTRVQPTGVSLGLPPGVFVQPYTAWRGLLTASYEVDLFGRISDNVAAARSDYESSEAAFRSVLLALQADVAQTYFALRQTDAELVVTRETVKLRAESLRLVQRRFDAGDISELDLARAKTELALAQNDAIALERRRAQLEHALAVLLGRAPASFDLVPAPLVSDVPAIPAGLPSALLERRPDIAAAQRQMAATNSRIGIAKAAFYPVLNITAIGGYESSQLDQLFRWSSRTWAIGPIAGTMLTGPLFEGGRNRANLDRSYAALEESVAGYRQTVLSAFAEVEDNLAGLRTLAGQANATRDSVDSAARALKIADSRYRAGATGYLDVIDAERTLLTVQLLDVQIRGARAVSTVALVRALGGGWEAPQN